MEVWIGSVLIVFEIIGVVSAIDAVMRTRTAQGAIAWVISLVTVSYVAVPLYWIFGRSRYHGYIQARRSRSSAFAAVFEELLLHSETFALPRESYPRYAPLEALARWPFTRGNDARLLVDGSETFESIFEGIEAASEYVLVQFFIVKADEIGDELKRRLIDKAREGVRVLMLYDEIGSKSLPRAYVRELRQAGVDIRPFLTTRGKRNRFQLNFRNHRKIVVVDGRSGWVGGHNVGDEYLGRDPRFGHWRDTHLRVEGPLVQGLQISFAEDWYWATKTVPDLQWEPAAAAHGDRAGLILPSGPADPVESCVLFFLHAIHGARRKIWIASPYFVPDRQIISALQLAAMRGVDVRIMLPRKPDHLLVYLSAFSYYRETLPHGVHIYRYGSGFLHQKVLLVDENVAAVGTANLDNRSFRLNFEVTALLDDPEFAGQVQAMLERDFDRCTRARLSDYEGRSFWFRLGVQLARLAAPVQ